MPIEHEVDQERGLVRTRVWGRVTSEEVLSVMQDLVDVPFFRPEYDQLIDCTEVTEIDVDSNVVRNVAKASAFASGVRRAAVAGSDLAFGMLRMWEAHADPEQAVRIFRSRSDAEKWLGVEGSEA